MTEKALPHDSPLRDGSSPAKAIVREFNGGQKDNFLGASNVDLIRQRIRLEQQAATPIATGPVVSEVNGGQNVLFISSRAPMSIMEDPKYGKLSVLATLREALPVDGSKHAEREKVDIVKTAAGELAVARQTEDGELAVDTLSIDNNRPTEITLGGQTVRVSHPYNGDLSVQPAYIGQPDGGSAIEMTVNYPGTPNPETATTGR